MGLLLLGLILFLACHSVRVFAEDWRTATMLRLICFIGARWREWVASGLGASIRRRGQPVSRPPRVCEPATVRAASARNQAACIETA